MAAAAEQAHTPGPWIAGFGAVADLDNREHFGVGLATEPWTVIALISRPEKVNDVDHANARLIAAAPDLLHAAQAALVYDEAIRRHAEKGARWVDDGELDRLYEHWINASAGAIAKATGVSA